MDIHKTRTSGTQVQVRYYSDHLKDNIGSLNCGEVEISEHLCSYLDKTRTILFTAGIDTFGNWLARDKRTNQEIAY